MTIEIFTKNECVNWLDSYHNNHTMTSLPAGENIFLTTEKCAMECFTLVRVELLKKELPKGPIRDSIVNKYIFVGPILMTTLEIEDMTDLIDDRRVLFEPLIDDSSLLVPGKVMRYKDGTPRLVRVYRKKPVPNPNPYCRSKSTPVTPFGIHVLDYGCEHGQTAYFGVGNHFQVWSDFQKWK
jgi:hypothetical protein